ncbi:MAG: hypothetical protein ABIE70_02915 [bacterium]
MMPRPSVRFVSAMVFLLSGFLWGCSSNDGDKSGSDSNTADATAETVARADSSKDEVEIKDIAYRPVEEKWDLDGKPLSIGGLIFRTASQWTDHGAQDDKAAFYTYGPLQEDGWPAQVAVYFVPSDKAAGYKDYFQHWLEQIDLSHLDNPETAAIRHDREVGGMTAHVQSLFGTYFADPTAGQLAPPTPCRLLGVVVEAPDGVVLLELVGPDYTARVMIEAFMNGVYQLRQAG